MTGTEVSIPMYQWILLTHSYVRWLILIFAIFVVVRSFVAWVAGSIWGRSDEKLFAALVGFVDLQFLLGLVLYAFFSPFTGMLFANPGAAMKEPIVRFFSVEHILGMLIAVAVIHIGQRRAKKPAPDRTRHRRAWTFTLLALLIIGASIPWPDSSHGRPLFRQLP
jgi:hypothetical protein